MRMQSGFFCLKGIHEEFHTKCPSTLFTRCASRAHNRATPTVGRPHAHPRIASFRRRSGVSEVAWCNPRPAVLGRCTPPQPAPNVVGSRSDRQKKPLSRRIASFFCQNAPCPHVSGHFKRSARVTTDMIASTSSLFCITRSTLTQLIIDDMCIVSLHARCESTHRTMSPFKKTECIYLLTDTHEFSI